MMHHQTGPPACSLTETLLYCCLPCNLSTTMQGAIVRLRRAFFGVVHSESKLVLGHLNCACPQSASCSGVCWEGGRRVWGGCRSQEVVWLCWIKETFRTSYSIKVYLSPWAVSVALSLKVCLCQKWPCHERGLSQTFVAARFSQVYELLAMTCSSSLATG